MASGRRRSKGMRTTTTKTCSKAESLHFRTTSLRDQTRFPERETALSSRTSPIWTSLTSGVRATTTSRGPKLPLRDIKTKPKDGEVRPKASCLFSVDFPSTEVECLCTVRKKGRLIRRETTAGEPRPKILLIGGSWTLNGNFVEEQ